MPISLRLLVTIEKRKDNTINLDIFRDIKQCVRECPIKKEIYFKEFNDGNVYCFQLLECL